MREVYNQIEGTGVYFCQSNNIARSVSWFCIPGECITCQLQGTGNYSVIPGELPS